MRNEKLGFASLKTGDFHSLSLQNLAEIENRILAVSLSNRKFFQIPVQAKNQFPTPCFLAVSSGSFNLFPFSPYTHRSNLNHDRKKAIFILHSLYYYRMKGLAMVPPLTKDNIK